MQWKNEKWEIDTSCYYGKVKLFLHSCRSFLKPLQNLPKYTSQFLSTNIIEIVTKNYRKNWHICPDDRSVIRHLFNRLTFLSSALLSIYESFLSFLILVGVFWCLYRTAQTLHHLTTTNSKYLSGIKSDWISFETKYFLHPLQTQQWLIQYVYQIPNLSTPIPNHKTDRNPFSCTTIASIIIILMNSWKMRIH